MQREKKSFVPFVLVIFASIHSNACMLYCEFLGSLIDYFLSLTFSHLKHVQDTKCRARQHCYLVPSGITGIVDER